MITYAGWDSLHPDDRAVMDDGDKAVEEVNIKGKESFQGWLRIARAMTRWRELAMQISGDDDMNSYAYRKAFGGAEKYFPNLAKLNKAERSQSVWLWDHHTELEQWHRHLPAPEASRYNHPSTIWRKNPLHEFREKKPRKKTEAADKINEAASRMGEVLERAEDVMAFNPGLDMSSPERIKESGEVIVDYYGAKDTAQLLLAAAPRTGLLVFMPDGQPPQTMADSFYDWLPIDQRQDFATHFAQRLAKDPEAQKPRPRRRKIVLES